ncbi:Panacea domain-containing protein [Chryseobacterium geocarposphaerae]|nr:type II toxin-antitoxin system antitoxin SocA domain-containing protein [Chryseobacterium geocarposphaerae]
MAKVQNILDVSDYIIFRTKSEGEGFLSFLKLQKLLYYTQAWYLAFNNDKLFDSNFQAWIHGPVNRLLFDTYKQYKFMYSDMLISDIQGDGYKELSDDIKLHIDNVLDAYAGFSSSELERMTHEEDPWIDARKGFSDYERCEVIISDDIMKNYYAARIKK